MHVLKKPSAWTKRHSYHGAESDCKSCRNVKLYVSLPAGRTMREDLLGDDFAHREVLFVR